MTLQIVEVIEGFHVHAYFVQPGARVWAWRRNDDVWVIYFNGADVPVPEGTVRPPGSAPERAVAASPYSAARLDQYTVAPASKK
jgi:hypothetical protein